MRDDRALLSRDLLGVLSRAQDSPDVVSAMLEAVARGIGCDQVALWLVDAEVGRLRRARVWRRAGAAAEATTTDTREVGEGLIGQVWARGRPLWDGAGPATAGAGRRAGCPTAAFPVVSGSSVLGVVEVSRPRPDPRDDDLLEVMAQTGVDVGGILQRLLEEENRRQLLHRLRVAERRQRFLADASRLLAGSRVPDVMLAQVAEAAVPFLGDGCVVHLAAGDGSVRVAAMVFADEAKRQLGDVIRRRYSSPPLGSPPLGHEDVGRVLQTGTSVLYPRVPPALLEARAHDAEHLRLLRALEPRSVMIVPLPGPEGTFGTLTLLRLEARSEPYGPDDLALAEDFGSRVGLAVANARLHERERTVAAALQRSLRPPELPDLPGLDLAARFHPGGQGVSVGGDFYDVFAVDDGLWVLGVGDVCGVGPEAAAMTARVRYTARAVASARRSPAEILTRVNALLTDPGVESRFCTAVYGLLRPTPGRTTATLACAGHPPPLLLRADGRVEAVKARGTLLGVVDDAEQRDEEVVLGPGDLLLLYTDGVIEARSRDAWFGEEGLRAVLAECRGMDCASVAARVQQEAVTFAGGAVCDDVAILAVRVPPLRTP